MKTIIAALVLTILVPAGDAVAQYGWGSCGVPPVPPVPASGCRIMQPVCVCDAYGRCYWQFICVR